MISIRRTSIQDARLLFKWANETQVRSNAISQNEITWEGHLKWLESKLNTRTSHMFILENENTPIGQIRFDKIELVYEIDYSIDKQFRGKKLGSIVVNKGIKMLRMYTNRTVIAKVYDENIASIKIFTKLGFVNIGIESFEGRKFIVFKYKSK